MKQSEPLELVEPGTLIRPGPIGRLVRLSLGVLCLYAFVELFYYAEWITTQPFSSLDNGYFRPNRRKGAVVGMVFMRSFPTFSSLF